MIHELCITNSRQIFKFTQLACKNIESNKHVKRSEWKITATKTGLKFGTVNPEAVFTNQVREERLCKSKVSCVFIAIQACLLNS